MIAYDLTCDSGHTFEGWFENAGAYQQQQRKGLVSCPICESICVSRVPSTFGIKSNKLTPKLPSRIDELNRKIVDFVDKHFDNVGTDFTKEALKIHYGVSEPRNIRGTSSDQEEKTLREEGVPFFKMPIPAASDPSED
jgi:hypothetical protein